METPWRESKAEFMLFYHVIESSEVDAQAKGPILFAHEEKASAEG